MWNALIVANCISKKGFLPGGLVTRAVCKEGIVGFYFVVILFVCLFLFRKILSFDNLALLILSLSVPLNPKANIIALAADTFRVSHPHRPLGVFEHAFDSLVFFRNCREIW